MLASIVANYLTYCDISYTWFSGMVDDEQFTERFRVTICALKAEDAPFSGGDRRVGRARAL